MNTAESKQGSWIDILASLEQSSKRLTEGEAEILYQNAPLTELGRAAHALRCQQNPSNRATYLVDRNINYTNVCNSDCSFCGFYRHSPDHPEAYVLSKESIGKKIEEALSIGATRILMQGGHNDELPYSFYTDLIDWLTKNFDIELNAFSPSEIHQMQFSLW